MAKISELQLVQPNEALDENGLMPVVVNTENGKKICDKCVDKYK